MPTVKALASTEVDVSSVKPGNTITVLWRGNQFLLEEELKKKFLKQSLLKWKI